MKLMIFVHPKQFANTEMIYQYMKLSVRFQQRQKLGLCLCLYFVLKNLLKDSIGSFIIYDKILSKYFSEEMYKKPPQIMHMSI